MTPTNAAPPPRVFLGSSTEGREAARYLQSELERLGDCEVTCWDQDIFRLSGYALESLEEAAASADFAVLLATPDDSVVVRTVESAAPRDNVIFELGLFVGQLGRHRTYLVTNSDPNQGMRLPSDLAGLTVVPYRSRRDGNIRAALNDAVLAIKKRVDELGRRTRSGSAAFESATELQALNNEIDTICASARAQGWTVRTASSTALRLIDPRGRKHTLPLGRPDKSRVELREFSKELRASGLRISRSVRQPVEDSFHP